MRVKSKTQMRERNRDLSVRSEHEIRAEREQRRYFFVAVVVVVAGDVGL